MGKSHASQYANFGSLLYITKQKFPGRKLRMINNFSDMKALKPLSFDLCQTIDFSKSFTVSSGISKT